MRVAYWKTEKCSFNQLLIDLSRSAHFPSLLNRRRARPYFLESVSLGSKDSGVCWAGSLSLPKHQPEPLQRSLSQEPLQVIFQETEPTSVLQPTAPLHEPVADLWFWTTGGGGGGKCRRHEDRTAAGAEGVFLKFLVLK